ncbi:SDR family NAD(P)-dependent oxidoreductase [Streptomyces sp. RLA2-12]|uniref:SDR family NAD(P)-dependent oxidoreductase n=1 Tax=Streptomyces sp. RLA2-12 TaxID=2721242 RepID=UPI00289E7181|nr:SDR family NAD(P)-dependent oxidoreductase [Streptomyces sp. RLA2-12]
MSDPVVLITGALTGIGRATALAYARQGANLVVSGRHEDVGEQFARELSDLGAPAEFVRADVRFDADVKDLVDRAVARFGRIDVAFNNAGTEGTPGPVTEVTDEGYQATFDTNVKGTLLCLKHEFRVMREQGGGSIVNVSSGYGLMGYPGATLYVGEQARRRRHHQGGRTGRRRSRYPGQRGRARLHPDRHVRAVHRRRHGA